jgi:uncharacterized protein (DUF885 family)
MEAPSFDAFLEDAYAVQLRRDPELVTELGLADSLGMDNGQLTNVSDAYQLQTYDLLEAQLTELRSFDRTSLTAEQQLSYDLFEWYLEDLLAGKPYRFYRHPVRQVLGVHTQLIELMTDRHPVATVEDGEDYVARLRQFPSKVDQLLDWLELQGEEGIVMPRFAIDNVIWQLNQFVDRSPERTTLYTTFVDKLDTTASIGEDEATRLSEEVLTAIAEDAQPAYGRLRDYFQALRPSAPAEGGLSRLPGGAEAYAYALGHYTTTDLTAEEIHQLGLDEVARIQSELDAAFEALGIRDGSLGDRIGRVAVQGGTVPSGQVLDGYGALIDEAQRALDPLFNARPQAEVVVKPFDVAGPAYYVGPSFDGSRPGTFYVGVGGSGWNFAMPTLAYHEAVPGHHFQVALAQELDHLPTFRRATNYGAYAEGWALYAELLAWEADWYDGDPYGNVGRLQSELFRAARLVVDTGIHAKGWTRDEAIAYMVENVGHSNGQARIEVERYILWPGQATSYKVGMLELLALRDEFKAARGDNFDIREFHDVVLLEGPMPLEILGEVVHHAAAGSNSP